MKKIIKKTKINSKIFAAIAVLCCNSPVFALDVAPYFESWSTGTLMEAKTNGNVDSVTLAFGITRGSCVFDTSFLQKLQTVRTYMGAGGKVLLSLGGADGVYAEIACRDDNQLYNILEKIMLDSGSYRLDFDVEGSQLNNSEASARRARVLARLQAKYPNMYLSFTLPGWLRGLNAESINLLKTTVAAGVKIDMINIMTQSFGVENLRTMVMPSTVGQASIVTFQASVNQIAQIFPNKTSPQIYAMMGMTPMIGTNDDGSTFTLSDAQNVANFAKLNGVGLLSYWSLQRDKAQSVAGMMPLNNYSGVVQSSYQFYKIFKSAAGQVSVPVTPPVVTPPVVQPAPPSACGGASWVVNTNYAAGSIVTYEGRQYQAKFANPGYNPTVSTYYWAPYTCAKPVPVVCPSTAWVAKNNYVAGSIVTYGGRQYQAKFANPGYIPTVSTYYWAAYYCA